MEHGEADHRAMHQMDQPIPCDHADCGNGCLATGAPSKAEAFPKLFQFFDLDQATVSSTTTFRISEQLVMSKTGPPDFQSSPPSTPVTRRDLLLE